MKYSKICFGFISVLGLLFLTIFIASIYLTATDAINILASLPEQLLSILLFGGIALLTIGIIGIGRLQIKNHKNLFTALAAIAIPSLTFAFIFFLFALTFIPATMFPMRSKITNVSVVSNSPLILSVDVKAITTRHTTIEGASIQSIDDNTIVTHCALNQFFELPAHSTKTLILNFNTTIHSGNYILQLTSWYNHHGSLLFTLP